MVRGKEEEVVSWTAEKEKSVKRRQRKERRVSERRGSLDTSDTDEDNGQLLGLLLSLLY